MLGYIWVVAVRGLYWFGLILAGWAIFLPDRRTREAVSGGNDNLGWIVIGVAAVALILVVRAERSTVEQRPAALGG
jgi:hypothetical protein